MSNNAFEAISPDELETITGGADDPKSPKPVPITPPKPEPLAPPDTPLGIWERW